MQEKPSKYTLGVILTRGEEQSVFAMVTKPYTHFSHKISLSDFFFFYIVRAEQLLKILGTISDQDQALLYVSFIKTPKGLPPFDPTGAPRWPFWVIQRLPLQLLGHWEKMHSVRESKTVITVVVEGLEKTWEQKLKKT